MLKKPLLLLILLFSLLQLQAQVKRKVKRGRRNKSESQFMLHKQQWQLEWEFGKETINDQLYTSSYPDFTLHYAVSDRWEVNGELNLLSATDNTTIPAKHIHGFEPIQFGASYLLIEDTKTSPSVILSLQLGIPFLASKDFRADYLAPVFQVSIEESIRDKWAIAASPGVFYDGFSTSPSFIFSLSTAYQFLPKWKIGSDWSGFINDNPPQHNLDFELDCEVNKRLELGFVGGFGISKAAHQSYFALNGTWTIH